MKYSNIYRQSIILGIILIVIYLADSSPVCDRTPQADVNPASCIYGSRRDYCHRLVCLQGPGKRCGVGRESRFGICASGLVCACDKCTGCEHTTLKCYTGRFC